jgi:hypothetical protein
MGTRDLRLEASISSNLNDALLQANGIADPATKMTVENSVQVLITTAQAIPSPNPNRNHAHGRHADSRNPDNRNADSRNPVINQPSGAARRPGNASHRHHSAACEPNSAVSDAKTPNPSRPKQASQNPKS